MGVGWMDTRPPPVCSGRRGGQKTWLVGDSRGGDWLSNFLGCIASDVHTDVSGDFAMKLDRDGKVAQALDGLGELNFATVDVEALVGEFTSDVSGGDGAK